MKRAFLLMVVPALLVALGFSQTPAASVNTDQTNIKGCLGGSDANYTVVEDNTGHIYKITTSSVDLKPHLGHDVTLIGHRASGASSAGADNSFAVTELNMISEHCAAAAAAPTATVSTPSETASTPPAPAAAPTATISTLAETAITPAVAATPPAEAASTPAAAAHPTRLPAGPRRLSATPPAAATTTRATRAVTAGTSSETVSTPDAAATTPAATAGSFSETDSTPAAVPTTPTAPARRGSLWLLISFAVLVIVIGILAPSLSRWRKRKSLQRTGTPNLSFTREANSDQGKSDQPVPRKVA